MRISDWSSDVCSSDLSPNGASTMNSPQPSPASAPALSTWASRRNEMDDDHIEEVQLDLEVEEPPAPQREPETADEIDPATEAFARLERSAEHTSELQSLMRISYAVFCLKKQRQQN